MGEPCFLVGNGPSLNKHNLEPLKKYFTIGINRTFYKLDTTILMWQDLQLWHTDKNKILRTQSIKYCSERSDIQGRFYHFKLAPGDYKLPIKPTRLFGRGSTGPLAFQLAYILGCNPVVLLGMDCCYEEGKTDFYGVNPMHKPHTLRNCKKGLTWMKECKSDINIINCSNNKIFEEKHELNDALQMIDNLKPAEREVWIKRIVYHNK